MRVREFQANLWLPHKVEKVFPFFGDAANLDVLTPPWLNFRILTSMPILMREGALIDYQLQIRGIPIRWRTRIVAWEPPYRFVDEQVRGPYRLWRHEHLFEPQRGGTLARDRVQYAVPFDFLVHRWLVAPDIERIFKFREAALRTRFND